MDITFKLYATLGDYLPAQFRRGNAMPLAVEEGATISQVIAPFGMPPELVHLVLVNGVYIAPEARGSYALKPNDTLAIWPPIAGG